MTKESRLKRTEATIVEACKELEKFEIETPTKIFNLPPTNKCDGWLAIFIDIPSLEKQNSLPKAKAGASATEPLNNKESVLAE